MPPEILKASWLNREPQFSAFTNGLLLDFWQTREERQFIGVDDVPIHYVSFCAPHHDKILVISPGRSESYVKYPEVAYDFYHLGYDILIIDHRGQGCSGRMLDDRQKGHVELFDHYVDDFAKLVELELTPRRSHRCYALAHSMGGAILSRYLLRNQKAVFCAAALCAPMFGINLPMPRWLANFLVNQAEPKIQKRNAYALSTGRWRPLPYLINLLTHSYARYQRYLRYYADYPELRLGGPTYHWMRESMLMGDKLIENADKIQTPLMVLQASEDKIVSNRELLAFCKSNQKARTGKKEQKPLVIQGAHHEILFEKDVLRAQALNAICDFFDQN
ncbi:lysophospholipase L2 [Xenorhabdus mauleonii]|uniref:Lysophospholipase n=1 Tax=Xenorhabdus mauleonii TaxID=351675 RepID=A0A1I3L4T8_9GAMM|nr:lysophospholipase L2 [Xenorhabdus mauleonii]PHM44548.1 lysophospholipase L2 [Xenorhabdus mauleonii]SFI79699.1 lysophospholipase [Xenorhabdus mauleonii]